MNKCRLLLLTAMQYNDIYQRTNIYFCDIPVIVNIEGVCDQVNWLLFNDISVISVTAHRCVSGMEKFDLRSGSKRHRHCVGFFNVPVQALTRGQPFYGDSEKPPYIVAFYDTLRIRLCYGFTPYQRLWLYNGAPLVAFYDTLGIRRTYSRLKPPASSRGKRTPGLKSKRRIHSRRNPGGNTFCSIWSQWFAFSNQWIGWRCASRIQSWRDIDSNGIFWFCIWTTFCIRTIQLWRQSRSIPTILGQNAI